MKSYRFVIANVFAETYFGGNQLVVIHDGAGLKDRVMRPDRCRPWR
jgi:predicted PhzF superfamily epimerase YddE/YHI9